MDPEPEGDLRPPTRYLLPDELRSDLAQAFGPIVQDDGLVAAINGSEFVAAVGDIVSITLKEQSIEPRFFVCDYKTQRGDESDEYRDALGEWGDREVKVLNPAGTITRKAWSQIRDACSRDDTTRIVVNGEEDLLGIPAFLEAPNGAKVLYGVPGQGIAVVSITPSFKDTVRDLLARFDVE